MVVRALKQDVPFNDTIAGHFELTHGISFLTLNSTTYETIKSKGVRIISNDSLRKEIQMLYQRYESLQKFLDRVNNESDNTLNKYQQELHIVLEAPYKGRNNQPVDYEGLKSNFQYINTLQDNSNNLYTMVFYSELVLESVKKLLENIQKEIKTMQ